LDDDNDLSDNDDLPDSIKIEDSELQKILDEKDSDSDEDKKETPQKAKEGSHSCKVGETPSPLHGEKKPEIKDQPKIDQKIELKETKEEIKEIAPSNPQEKPKLTVQVTNELSKQESTQSPTPNSPERTDSPDNKSDNDNESNEIKYSLDAILKESDDEESSKPTGKLSPVKKDNILFEKAQEEEREKMQDPLEIIDRYENNTKLKEDIKTYIYHLEGNASINQVNYSRLSFSQYKAIGTMLASTENDKVAGRPSCIAVFSYYLIL
jgi:hypothetical protein